jgi:hypothetical protein
MTNEPQNLIESIRAMVAEHYRKASSPLLLSQLGKILKDKGLWPIAGTAEGSLRKLIEDTSDPDLIIVRDPNAAAYIVVTDSANHDKINAIIAARKKISGDLIDLARLPKSFLNAFCVRQEGMLPVFLSKTQPHEYLLTVPLPEKADEYWRIDTKYRLPGLRIGNIERLPDSIRRVLNQKIERWSADIGVNPDSLYVAQSRDSNALSRLFAAQSPEIAKKLLIPADIALLLSEHE